MPKSSKLRSRSGRSTVSREHGDRNLERAKNLATIVSALAIPIVLAVAGYFVQRELSNEGLKKDYVGIAAGILKEDSSKQEPDLRSWAVKVLDDNSPVPFSKKAKEGLRTGAPIVLPGPAWLGPPKPCREPVKTRRVLLTNFEKLSREAGSLDQKELTKRLVDFSELAVKEESVSAETAARLRCLQDWVTYEEKADIEYRERIGAPSSNSIFEQLQREKATSAAASRPSK